MKKMNTFRLQYVSLLLDHFPSYIAYIVFTWFLMSILSEFYCTTTGSVKLSKSFLPLNGNKLIRSRSLRPTNGRIVAMQIE